MSLRRALTWLAAAAVACVALRLWLKPLGRLGVQADPQADGGGGGGWRDQLGLDDEVARARAALEAVAASANRGGKTARDAVGRLCAQLAERGDDRDVPVPYRALAEVLHPGVYTDLCAFFCGVNASVASDQRIPPPLALHVYPVDHACFAGDGVAELPREYTLAFKALQVSALIVERQLPTTVHAARVPATADMYWVPNYFDRRVQVRGNAESPVVLAAKLACLAANEPLFQRNQGLDHIATLTNDYGPCLARAWYLAPELGVAAPALRAIAVAAFNGETESRGECFRPGRDIVLPPMVPFAYLPDSDCLFDDRLPCSASRAPRPPSARARLGFMSGRVCWPADPSCAWYSRGVRQRLYAAFGPNGTHAAAASDAIVFAQQTFEPEAFLGMLRTSEFCLCAPGYALWTPRPVEALWAGCIPALLGLDHYVPPFGDLIDWSRFSVAVAAHEVDGASLLARLQAVPVSERERMRAVIGRIHHVFRLLPGGHQHGHDALDLLVFQLWRTRKHAVKRQVQDI